VKTNVHYTMDSADNPVVSYNTLGVTFVLDLAGALMQRAGLGNEQSNGFSWLAIGF